MISVTGLNILVPLLQQIIVDDGIMKNDLATVGRLLIGLMVVYLLISIIEIAQNYVQTYISLNVSKDLEVSVFNHALRLKVECIKEKGLYKIIKDVDNYVQSVADLTGGQTVQVFIELFKFVGIFIALFLLSWKVTIYLLLLIPLRLIITHFTSKQVRKNSEESFAIQKYIHQWEDDVYNVFTEIKLWNLIGTKTNEYQKLIKKRNKKVILHYLLSGIDTTLGSGLQQLVISSLYLLCGFFIVSDEMTIGILFTFITYSYYILQPISLISYLKIIISKIAPEYAEYQRFISLEEEEDKNIENTVQFPSPIENLKITFNNVSFKYNDKMVLRNVNFEVNSGDVVVIKGENGSGKSTIIDLLLRFYYPCDGDIRINDININKINLESYRENLSVVSQFSNLFTGTIEDNLSMFGKYSYSEHLVDNNLFDFFGNLEKGIKNKIGSKSSLLSGGEKQKVSLLRSLAKRSRILILDEPTSNFDKKSEELFKDLIKSIDCDIVILVTHSEDISEIANKTIYLNNGEIICSVK